MKPIRILDYNDDMNCYIDENITLHFEILDTKKTRDLIFPVLLKNEIEIELPENERVLTDFLSKKIKKVEKNEAEKLVNYAGLNILSYLMSVLKNENADILLYKGIIIVNATDDNECVFLSKKLIPYDELLRLQKFEYSENYSGIYREALENIINYIKTKVNNNISNNATLSFNSKEFKKLHENLTIQLNRKSPNLVNILLAYEKLIAYRSAFFLNETNLLSDEELLEIIDEFNTLKEMVNQKIKVKINQIN